MLPQTEEFTIGVEEEYQIVDPQTRQLCMQASRILPAVQTLLGEPLAQLEFRQSQIEIATPVCRTLQDVRAQLSRLRGAVMTAAEKNGYHLMAAGTHPFSHWQEQLVTPKPSYLRLAQHYQHLMHELVTFGCHVHVGIGDRDMAIRVMNRARLWLAPLLALSASSPFWLGMDTGYASYRTVLISRLPMAGPPPVFKSYDEYNALVQSLIKTHVIQEATQICWDIRISERFPTLEFRIMDMCMTLDEAVMIAGLVRGLVRTCYEQALLEQPYRTVPAELLRAAHWNASRWGVDATLIDLEAERSVPAQQLIETFLTKIRPALEDTGEWDDVYALVQRTMQRGVGAARQRDRYRCTHSLEDVVGFGVREMSEGVVVPLLERS